MICYGIHRTMGGGGNLGMKAARLTGALTTQLASIYRACGPGWASVTGGSAQQPAIPAAASGVRSPVRSCWHPCTLLTPLSAIAAGFPVSLQTRLAVAQCWLRSGGECSHRLSQGLAGSEQSLWGAHTLLILPWLSVQQDTFPLHPGSLHAGSLSPYQPNVTAAAGILVALLIPLLLCTDCSTL